jgi:hypothetical protein
MRSSGNDAEEARARDADPYDAGVALSAPPRHMAPTIENKEFDTP